MFGSLYTSLSGLLGFQKALDVVSNNVANVNTPGFKGSDVFFRDLAFQDGGLSDQSLAGTGVSDGGVKVDGSRIRFLQGELQETSNDTDVAIDGNGFFILKDPQSNERFYTRAGQFVFDNDDFLIEPTSGARVQALNDAGALDDVTLAGFRSSRAEATSEVTFTGNLSLGDNEHEIEDINVFDADGNQRTLRLRFVNNNIVNPGSWLVEVFETGVDPVATGEIRFAGNGSPTEDFNSIDVFLVSNENTAAPELDADGNPIELDQEGFTFALNFGDPGTFEGATSFSGGPDSTLETADDIDGRGIGAITTITFDIEGKLNFNYSNGDEVDGQQLALAFFLNPQELLPIGENSFVATENANIDIGVATDGPFGEIRARNIELANVELSREFADIIVVQRGFQASSQVLNISSELLERLYNSVGGNG